MFKYMGDISKIVHLLGHESSLKTNSDKVITTMSYDNNESKLK
jgi:hypothetical protein